MDGNSKIILNWPRLYCRRDDLILEGLLYM